MWLVKVIFKKEPGKDLSKQNLNHIEKKENTRKYHSNGIKGLHLKGKNFELLWKKTQKFNSVMSFRRNPSTIPEHNWEEQKLM